MQKTTEYNLHKNIIEESTYIHNLDLSKLPLRYENITDTYGTIGRWFKKTVDGVECLVSIYIGSELYFKVIGTSKLALNFKQVSNGDMPSIVYFIDDRPKVKIQVTASPMVIANNLDSSKEHFVRIKIEGITESNKVWVNEEGLIFAGGTVDAGGIISGIKPKNKRILFLGDSITAGLSVYSATETQPMSHGGSTNYAAICTQKLNAVDIRVAFGFTGIVNPGPNSIPPAMGYIDYMTATRPETGEFPDLIVVNYGTNDASEDKTQSFITGYPKLLDKLTIKYGELPIFAVIPFNQSRVEEIKNAVAGRSNVFLVDTATWNYAGVTHPNAEDSLWLGENLANEILKITGKQFFS